KSRQWLAWAVIWFSASTVFFLSRFGYKYLDDVARQRPGTFAPRLIEEMTGAYSAALLFLFIILLIRKYHLQQKNWLRQLPIHLLLVVCFSVADTSLMALTRKTLFPLFGLGNYDYGIMPVRYFMEFGEQTLCYVAVVALVYLFDHYREARERELRTARLETQL